MNKRLIIFAPFFSNLEPSSGTTIRIAGYTKGFNEMGVNYLFYSKVKPSYVNDKDHIKCNIKRRWSKLLVLHNILYSKLRILSYPLRLLINWLSGVKELKPYLNNSIILTHQENSLALYLYFTQKQLFIYDVHGFFDLQQKKKKELNAWKSIWFGLNTLHESIVLKEAPFLNVVSEAVKTYVIHRFLPKGELFIAPDGVPEDISVYERIQPKFEIKKANGVNETEKIILFAGSFKKYGGILELLKTYLSVPEINQQATLIIIGAGDGETNVKRILSESVISKKVHRINKIPHHELIAIMKTVDVIVCPDIEGNRFNEITPHIKLYDAIASGTNVVATGFQVNKDLFPSKEFNIFYFSHSKPETFKQAILEALEKKPDALNQSIKNLTYYSRANHYVHNIKKNETLKKHLQ